jgi:hypothetical protein
MGESRRAFAVERGESLSLTVQGGRTVLESTSHRDDEAAAHDDDEYPAAALANDALRDAATKKIRSGSYDLSSNHCYVHGPVSPSSTH